MKKMLFVIAVLLSTAQIVKAQKKDTAKVTTLDATLKLQGTQNEASTMAWLQSDKPDASLINMPIRSFNKEFLNSLSQLNAKYGTFPSIDGDVINDQIIPNLYTAELDPDKLYCFSRYDLATGKWGNWWRKPKKLSNGRIESGLFYEGWDEPVLSVWCWNFGYPFKDKPITPKIPKPETEYVYIPGKTKVIEYGPDSVFVNRTKVQIEKNNNMFASYTNNQSYEVDMTPKSAPCNHQVQQQCNHQQQVSACNHQVQQCNHQQQIYEQPSCGCKGNYSCRKHRDRKPFFQSTGFKILSYAFAVGVGWVLNDVFDRNDPRVGNLSGITQGPFVPLPGTNPIYTQGPLFQ